MTEMMTEELTLKVSRLIAAPAEKVYAAWLNPDTLRRFLGGDPGVEVGHVETDPRVGGSFRIDMCQKGHVPMAHTGTYLALDPYRHIAFTWASHVSTVEGSTVTIDLKPEDAGTLLTLTHRRFSSPQNRDGHARGWAMFLDALAGIAL